MHRLCVLGSIALRWWFHVQKRVQGLKILTTTQALGDVRGACIAFPEHHGHKFRHIGTKGMASTNQAILISVCQSFSHALSSCGQNPPGGPRHAAVRQAARQQALLSGHVRQHGGPLAAAAHRENQPTHPVDPEDHIGRFKRLLRPMCHDDIFTFRAGELNERLRMVFILEVPGVRLGGLTQETTHTITCSLLHESTIGCSREHRTKGSPRQKALRIDLLATALRGPPQRHRVVGIDHFKGGEVILISPLVLRV
mmetsp:Transcript_3962/g.6531  ORF Transcript_3962/g.6531 Transcript_3962/m.6531 type:complete len:254 (-) Transcript_3962:97-858(-)